MKTMIAEMAIYHTLLQELGKALYLVPYKALATEKCAEFTATLTSYGFYIGIATSDYDEVPLLNTLDLLITPYKKGDAILRERNFQKGIVSPNLGPCITSS
jgi:replicative superfamily II helicase